MFERLKSFFHRVAPPPAPLPELDAAHALGALLVKVALVDDAYLFEEVEEIDHILAEAYGLKPLAAARMRASHSARRASTIRQVQRLSSRTSS